MNRSLAFAPLALLASLAGAQSRSSAVYFAAGNNDANPGLFAYAADFSGSGDYRSINPSKSWTGMDSGGQSRTMTFAGDATAESNYGRLRTSVDARLSNIFYNSENPIYFNGDPGAGPNDDGVADNFLAASVASFTDRLAFGGGAFTGYKARYTFFVHGSATGSNVSANLRVSIAGNAFEQLDVDLSSGTVGEYWTTKAYTVGASFDQTANVQFTTRFDAYAGAYSDGDNAEGAALFNSTITLTAVGLYDLNDNLVSNYTVTGDSGTAYPVPEPASMAALGLGAIGLLRRRNSRSSR